jgi:hypothetical protein
MDSNKLEAALRRLEDEQFGRTFNMPGIDPAVVGGWLRWLRDTPGLDLERLRTTHLRGEQEQPEPVAVMDAVPNDSKHGEA